MKLVENRNHIDRLILSRIRVCPIWFTQTEGPRIVDLRKASPDYLDAY
jgi:hypothetical protein